MAIAKTIKGLIFDFDGTIADTKQSIITTIKTTLQQMRIGDIPEEVIKDMIGLPLKDTFLEVGNMPVERLEEAILLYRQKYNDIALKKVTLFPAVAETLKYLSEQKKKMAVISSKGEVALLKLLRRLQIRDFFSEVIGEEGANKKKPDPKGVNIVLERIQLSPQETIVIGDTVYDIEMGKNANCLTCAVTHGNHERDRLQLADPDWILDNFSELRELLESEKEKLDLR